MDSHDPAVRRDHRHLALAAQFNSLRDPIVILVSVPMAMFGR
ncbi:hypothetical protein [Dokdonella sp.]